MSGPFAGIEVPSWSDLRELARSDSTLQHCFDVRAAAGHMSAEDLLRLAVVRLSAEKGWWRDRVLALSRERDWWRHKLIDALEVRAPRAPTDGP